MPRNKTVTYKVFKFSELSEKAKEKAKQDHFEVFGYYMADEALESLKKLAEHFDGKLVDWSIDWTGGSYSSAKFNMPGLNKHHIKPLLDKLGKYNPKTLKGLGECKLTGCCTDEDAIDGFRIAFWKDRERLWMPNDLERYMQAAFKHWLRAQQANYDTEWSDEQFGETCEANGWEFRENGEIDR